MVISLLLFAILLACLWACWFKVAAVVYVALAFWLAFRLTLIKYPNPTEGSKHVSQEDR